MLGKHGACECGQSRNLTGGKGQHALQEPRAAIARQGSDGNARHARQRQRQHGDDARQCAGPRNVPHGNRHTSTRRQQRRRHHHNGPYEAADSRSANHRSATDRATGRVHGTGHERLGAKRAGDILRIVVAKCRERRLHRSRLGTIALITRQAGHDHVEQLGIDKRQRIAQILGIWIEPQLLSLFGRGKCHIGLASQQLRQVAAGRVGADGIIGQRIHLETIRAGDIARLFARARSTRRARRYFVRRDTGDELIDRARRGIHVDCRRHAQNAQVGNIVGEHLGRSVGNRRATQRGVALGKGLPAAGSRHRRGRLERQRRAKIDEAQIERAFGKLSVER